MFAQTGWVFQSLSNGKQFGLTNFLSGPFLARSC
jgi:hypothetical protein